MRRKTPFRRNIELMQKRGRANLKAKEREGVRNSERPVLRVAKEKREHQTDSKAALPYLVVGAILIAISWSIGAFDQDETKLQNNINSFLSNFR